MTLNFHALWTLTGMGAVVFSTFLAPTRPSRALAAAAFAVTAAWSLWFGPPSPEVVGLAAAMGAIALLLRPASVLVGPVLGGGLAGVWGAMLAAQGVPWWLAVPLAAIGPVAACLRARRPEFAPPQLRDEALIIVTVCALAVAMLPGVMDGWQAAVNLSVQSSEQAAAAVVPAWTLAIGASALTLGALYSMWSRR